MSCVKGLPRGLLNLFAGLIFDAFIISVSLLCRQVGMESHYQQIPRWQRLCFT